MTRKQLRVQREDAEGLAYLTMTSGLANFANFAWCMHIACVCVDSGWGGFTIGNMCYMQ